MTHSPSFKLLIDLSHYISSELLALFFLHFAASAVFLLTYYIYLHYCPYLVVNFVVGLRSGNFLLILNKLISLKGKLIL